MAKKSKQLRAALEKIDSTKAYSVEEAVATLVLLGVPDPFSTPAAFFKRTAAGGVLVMKVNDLSS